MGKSYIADAAVISHIGCERKNNEDNFSFNGDMMPVKKMDEGAFITRRFTQTQQLYAVCDGMGGEKFGERAAYLCAYNCSLLYAGLKANKAEEQIKNAIIEASDTVYKDMAKHLAKAGGSTVALLALIRDTAWIANVGDSRVYLYRNKQLIQLSFDHSEVNMLRQAGVLTAEKARKSARNVFITQYVGMSSEKRSSNFVYQKKQDVRSGDRWMLCSDGLCDLLPEEQIAMIMGNDESAETTARKLVMTALELSGKDNVTVIVVDIK